uniref:Uncharacterized protein n=2 Tax=Ciona intestinalis TaxID=7719 RepID=F6PYX2_CIOIN
MATSSNKMKLLPIGKSYEKVTSRRPLHSQFSPNKKCTNLSQSPLKYKQRKHRTGNLVSKTIKDDNGHASNDDFWGNAESLWNEPEESSWESLKQTEKVSSEISESSEVVIQDSSSDSDVNIMDTEVSNNNEKSSNSERTFGLSESNLEVESDSSKTTTEPPDDDDDDVIIVSQTEEKFEYWDIKRTIKTMVNNLMTNREGEASLECLSPDLVARRMKVL